ncbi:fibronectin type III domain-containing protein [Patescibacteria group bacterium]|nr:fibronectin type III domain-containing protein [Patescibacteria group bacterium]
MNNLKIPKKILDKRIPTILGTVVLVIALISGTLLIGKGGGVFSPRASVETTPKNVKVSNVHDTSFTISFLTDNNTAGFVKYGAESNSLKSQASNDRDQISGTVGEFQIHHITIRGLEQATTYYYLIGTGSGDTFDDNGQPFRIKTASRNGAPAAAKTIYGSVTTETGAPAEGSVVYVDINRAGTMSSQVKASGSWAIPLSNARTIDGNAYASISDQDNITINVQGPLSTQKTFFSTTVEHSQPVTGMTFGQKTIDTNISAKETDSIREFVSAPINTVEDVIDKEMDIMPIDTIQKEIATDSAKITDRSNRSALLDDLINEDVSSSESAIITKLDLELTDHQTVTTSTPIITGKALPGIAVSISVHSDTQIQQEIIADENGEFVLDISELSESLEPGEHSVTYSYTDPDTGEIVEKTVNFTVSDTSQQLADAGDYIDDEADSAPYGSGNPYPIDDATDSAEASNSAEATDEARTSQPATDEGVPVSGSVGTTMALIFGGLFFIISGLWSFWISTQLEKGELGG